MQASKMELVRSKLVDEYHKRCERHGKAAGGEQVLKVQKVNRTCFFCKQPGHFKKDCPKWLAVKDKQHDGSSGSKPGSSGRNKGQFKAKQVTNTARDPVSFIAQDENHISYAALNRSRSWTVDSGASCHMTSSGTFFDTLDESTCVRVMMANGNHTKSGGFGSGFITGVDDEGNPVDIKLNDVLFVPDLDSGLLSVSKITDKGYEVLFKKKTVEIIDKSNKIVALGERSGGLYPSRWELQTKN